MRTFIVLIPVDNSIIDSRKACEMIENMKYKNEGSIQYTANDILSKIMFELGIDKPHDIEVEAITDFMDRFNDELLNADDYFISYVYG